MFLDALKFIPFKVPENRVCVLACFRTNLQVAPYIPVYGREKRDLGSKRYGCRKVESEVD